jgi:membrane-bound metal-dependent hydrolase YbcI (DUF457 family)
MLVGHYAAAFVARAASPGVPLWLLALAVQLVDVLWALLVLLGIERLSLDPSLASNPLVLEHMPYTHSLVGTLVWASLAGLATKRWLGSTPAALAVAAAVTSHWPLDVLVHRPDMTLWGSPPKLGLGLWNHPAAAIALELGLLVAGAALSLRTGAIPAARRRAVLALVGALAAVQIVTSAAPPPLGPAGVACTALILFLLVVIGARYCEAPAAATRA